MYRSTYSWRRHYLEVSGQLHAPVALPPGKEPSVPVRYGTGWAPKPAWTTWRKKNLASTETRNLTPRPSNPYPVAIPVIKLLESEAEYSFPFGTEIKNSYILRTLYTSLCVVTYPYSLLFTSITCGPIFRSACTQCHRWTLTWCRLLWKMVQPS
jgi:hypothetical protein